MKRHTYVPGRPSRPAEAVIAAMYGFDNDKSRAERRADLLNAFEELSPEEQADFIEAGEAIASAMGEITQTHSARRTLRRVRDIIYEHAGWS